MDNIEGKYIHVCVCRGGTVQRGGQKKRARAESINKVLFVQSFIMLIVMLTPF